MCMFLNSEVAGTQELPTVDREVSDADQQVFQVPLQCEGCGSSLPTF